MNNPSRVCPGYVHRSEALIILLMERADRWASVLGITLSQHTGTVKREVLPAVLAYPELRPRLQLIFWAEHGIMNMIWDYNYREICQWTEEHVLPLRLYWPVRPFFSSTPFIRRPGKLRSRSWMENRRSIWSRRSGVSKIFSQRVPKAKTLYRRWMRLSVTTQSVSAT